jgi:hypothetical protein
MLLLLAVLFWAVNRDPSQLLLHEGAWAHLADLAR